MQRLTTTTTDDKRKNYDNSVIKVTLTRILADYNFPWKGAGTQEASGSGFVCEWNGEKLILTNAHVIDGARYIQVSFPSDLSVTYSAKVSAVSHESDLALLAVDNPKFWKLAIPLELSDKITELEDPVSIVGFPTGGVKCSITSGTISRIDMSPYAHSTAELLVAHLTATALPGNSGGPIFTHGKVVGILHQSSDKIVAHMIPISLIKHFLRCSIFGRGKNPSITPGIPTLAINTQEMKNESMRKVYGLKSEKSGILIYNISKVSPALDILKKDDVLMKVGEYDIDNLGFIMHADCGTRIEYTHAITTSYINTELQVVVLREKREMTFKIKLTLKLLEDQLLPLRHDDDTADYFCRAGVIIGPLTRNLCNLYNNTPIAQQPELVKMKENFSDKSYLDEQVLYIREILASDESKGYPYVLKYQVIEEINGHKPINMIDAMRAFDSNKSDHHKIITTKGLVAILPAKDDIHLRKKYMILAPEAHYYASIRECTAAFFSPKLPVNKGDPTKEQQEAAHNKITDLIMGYALR